MLWVQAEICHHTCLNSVIMISSAKGMAVQRISTGAESPVYYQFNCWQNAPLKHGVFTRLGGVSQNPWCSLNVGSTVGDDSQAVAENRRRMVAALAISPQQVSTVWQVHGIETVVVNGPLKNGRGWLAKADGMVTNQVGLALTMRFADCVPIMLYDPEHHAIGIAHAGWRGTVDATVLSTLYTMQTTYNSRPIALQAGIGPSIGPEQYQVGEEVVAAAQARFETLDGLVKRATDGSAYFNLWEANRRLLADAGVQQIEVAGICTASHTDEFFSHRAEAGKTGRFGAVIALE